MRRFARILMMSGGLFLLPATIARSAPETLQVAPPADEDTCALPAGELAGAGELPDASELAPAEAPAHEEAEPAASCNIVFFCTPDLFILCGDRTICPCECE